MGTPEQTPAADTWHDGVKEGVDSLGGLKPEEGDSWGSWEEAWRG